MDDTNENFDFLLKKKKKKINQEVNQEINQDINQDVNNLETNDNTKNKSLENDNSSILDDLQLKKKKKKKSEKIESNEINETNKTNETNESNTGNEPCDNNDNNEDKLIKKKKKKIENTDTLITSQDESFIDYQFMLKRIYRTLENVNIILPEDAKIRLKPPQVIRMGKQTGFVNFLDICRSLNRLPEHFSKYISKEIGQNISINKDNILLMDGKYDERGLETIIVRYINDFVKCLICRNFNTYFDKDIKTRMVFLKCNNCFSQRSIQQI
jgi:translation initiation factor 2 subunit 2